MRFWCPVFFCPKSGITEISTSKQLYHGVETPSNAVTTIKGDFNETFFCTQGIYAIHAGSDCFCK
jgi:hypothetical protein